jgi:hypothetical protein
VDLALGYLKMAVPRPIPPVRVAEHVRDVFPQLLKFATQRASGRPLAAGEAFDPSVHAWDAATTYEDWKRAYTEVYSELPPDSILPQAAMGLFNVKQDSHTSVRVCGCVYGECGGGTYRCGCDYCIY